MSRGWIERRRRDYFYRMAKKEDLRSRASFKLLEISRKFDLIKEGDVVVDLGAAPGGWLQISRRIVGESGFVLGVDIKEIEPLGFSNVITIVGDIMEPDIIRRIRALLPRPADVVISDVSPNISGVWEVDHARQIELAERSLRIAVKVLREKGNFLVKVFQGDLQFYFLREVRGFFRFVRTFKPKASRKESAEIYVLGIGFKGDETAGLLSRNL